MIDCVKYDGGKCYHAQVAGMLGVPKCIHGTRVNDPRIPKIRCFIRVPNPNINMHDGIDWMVMLDQANSTYRGTHKATDEVLSKAKELVQTLEAAQ